MKKIFTFVLGCVMATSMMAQGAKEAYTVFDGAGKKVTYYYDDQSESREGIVELLSNENRWYDYCKQVTVIVIDESFKDYTPTVGNGIFYNDNNWCSFLNATSIININNINTSEMTDMSHMFDGMSNLYSLDLSTFQTDKVTDMKSMFLGCSKLKYLNLRSFDTKNVVNMSAMFLNCNALVDLDLSRFNFSKVLTTNSMFFLCTKLKHINMCNAKPSALLNAAAMFRNCSELETIYCDEDWTTYAWITNKTDMFTDCPKLKGTIGKFTPKPAMSYALFDGDHTVTYYHDKDYDQYRENIVMPPINTDQSYAFAAFSGKTAKLVIDPSFASSDMTEAGYTFNGPLSGIENSYYNVTEIEGLQYINTKTMTSLDGLFNNMKALPKVDLTGMDLSPVTKTLYMFHGCESLTTIYCTQDLSGISGSNSSLMFYGCVNLVGCAGTTYNKSLLNSEYAHVDEGEGNPGYFSTLPELYGVLDESTLTLYYDSKRLKNGGVVEWWNETSISGVATKVIVDESCSEAKVTSMNRWFDNFSELDSIIGLNNINTSKVTDMSYLFFSCTKLSYLDWDPTDAKAVKDMSYMFYGCQWLFDLDLSHLTTSSQLNFTSCMFFGCSSLQTLRLSDKFNTEGVTSMGNMFRDCHSLVVFPVENFEVDNVTFMDGMFRNCYNLGVLDLHNWHPSELKFSDSMFENCYDLTTVDLSYFDMTNIESASDMFRGCSSLKYIICKYDWSGIAGLSTSDNMFLNCASLVGGAGTPYNEGHVNYSWARLDKGEGNEGYFCEDIPLLYGVASDEGKTFTLYYDGNILENDGIYYWYSYNDFSISENITKVVLDPSVKDARPTSTKSWFYTWSKLEEIEHLDYLNTSAVTDMSFMFSQCYNLKAIDVSNFKTTNVTNMEDMFEDCSVEALALSSFDTHNVTDMSGMFSGCSELTDLSLYNFNTGNVTDMGFLFNGCSSLKNLDVSQFDTHSVTKMRKMFYGCESLTTLDLRNFDMSHVTDMSDMFGACSALVYIVCDQDWSELEAKSDDMFAGCTSLCGEGGTKYPSDIYVDSYYKDKSLARPDGGIDHPGYFCTHIPELYAFASDGDKTLTLYYDTNRELNSGITLWYSDEYRNSVTKIVLDTSIVFYHPIDMSLFFYGFKELTEIEHIDYLNTGDAVNMMMMFYGCEKLTSLDLSHFDTHNVNAFVAMFNGCKALQSVDLKAFDFSLASDLSEMFSGCTALETVDLRTWHSSELSLMFARMFDGCSALKNIYWYADWTSLDPSLCEDMFKGCTSLQGDQGTAFSDSHADNSWARLDGGAGSEGYFRLFDAKEVYTAYDAASTTLSFRNDNLRYFLPTVIYKDLDEQGYLYEYDIDITKVVFDESFAEVRPTDLTNWFFYYSNLETIEGIQFLNTSEATKMRNMFYYCGKLESLDLRHFDMSQVTDVSGMFAYCDGLKTILCDDNWSKRANIEKSGDMFKICSALVGGKGTAYDNANPKDITYARPDGGEKAPGYFTGQFKCTVTLKAENGKIEVAETEIDLNEVPEGTTLHLTAEPDFGYGFVTWSDGVTKPERELVVTSDTTITANFVVQFFTLTLKVTPEEGGVCLVDGLSKSNTGPYMAEFTLEAIPNEGYELDAWYDSEEKLEETSTKINCVLYGDMTMTCAFKKTYPTGIEECTMDKVQSTKVLRDGVLYIERNGHLYDATGRMVQ